MTAPNPCRHNFIGMCPDCWDETVRENKVIRYRVKELEEANSQLADAAIENPPYKGDLINRVKELEGQKFKFISNMAKWIAEYLCKKHNHEFLKISNPDEMEQFIKDTGCAMCNRDRVKELEEALEKIEQGSNLTAFAMMYIAKAALKGVSHE